MFWEDNKKKSYLEVADKNKKPILMLKDGVAIGKFKSIKDAQYFLNMKSNGNISECLAGRRNKVFGYSFIFENTGLLENVEKLCNTDLFRHVRNRNTVEIIGNVYEGENDDNS